MQGKIVHKTKSYSLTITPEKDQLQIILKLTKKNKKTFQVVLDNDSLSEEIQKNLRNVEIIYECFQDKQAFKVFEEEGRIVLITFILIRNKKIETLTEIILQEQAKNIQIEKVPQEIKFLKNEVFQLKKALVQKQQKQEISQAFINKMKQEIENKFFLMRKEFINDYEISDAQQKQEENQRIQVENQIIHLEHELQKSTSANEKLQERLKVLEDLCFKDMNKIRGRVEILQNKIGELFDWQLGKGQSNNKQQKPSQKLQKIIEKPPAIKVLKKQEPIKIDGNYPTIEEAKKVKVVVVNKQQNIVKKVNFYLQNQFTQFFRINDRKITYSGDNKNWTALLGKQILIKGRVYQFQFLIVRSAFNNIKIGVCNKVTVENDRQPSTDHSISIYGDNGQTCIPQYKPFSETKGFKESDSIIMKVDLKQYKISFRIKDKKEIILNEVSEYLSTGNKQIVPFICFYRKGDIVEWTK